MSAGYVRRKIEQWCEEAAQAHGVPFYKTINSEENPPDPVWFTVEFVALFIEGMLCEAGYHEDGAFRIVIMSQPGQGWEPAIDALEQIMPDILLKSDPSRRLVIDGYEPILEETGGSAEHTYIVSQTVNYIHRL